MDQSARNKLSNIDRAKIDLVSVYSINSLTWLYQITNGIDPRKTALPDELQRIQANMKKVKGKILFFLFWYTLLVTLGFLGTFFGEKPSLSRK